MVGASSTIGKVSPTIGKMVCRRIVLLFNKIAVVSDHGRKGSADRFCLSAECFCLSANVFISSPMFLSLRPIFLSLRQCFYLCADVFVSLQMVLCLRKCFCVFANVFVSPPIVFISLPIDFVSPPTVSCLRPWSLCLRSWPSRLRRKNPFRGGGANGSESHLKSRTEVLSMWMVRMKAFSKLDIDSRITF